MHLPERIVTLAWCAPLLVAVGLPNVWTRPSAGESQTPRVFRLEAITDGALGLWEGERPVLVYRHGVQSRSGVPAKYNRSSYVHPLYGLDGEILTDDFPKDHYHHRGVFWAWPGIRIDGKQYNLWMPSGIRQQFERWTGKTLQKEKAVLGVENGWYVGEKRVVREKVTITVHRASKDSQSVDFDFTWTAVDRPVTLWGAAGKSYGGFTLRYAPREKTVITVPSGPTSGDLAVTRLEWADLTARFQGAPGRSGAAIFIDPKHPDYPPTWLTRHYGVLCVGWPGVKPDDLEPGKSVRCSYRVWVHRGNRDARALGAAYKEYVNRK